MRLSRLVLLGPLVLGGLVLPLTAPPAAHAAEATCQGRAPTVTIDQATVTGTEGDDVIAASASTSVINGLGGNDVICAYYGTGVSAGSGNDSVLVTLKPDDPTYNADRPAVVNLGPGDDTYVGGPLADWVDTVSPADRLGADTISTGAGPDIVGSGAPGEPNRDTVDLGDGPDDLRLALPTGSSAKLAGGPGGAGMTLADPGAGSWTVDLRGSTGTITHDVPATLATLSDFADLHAALPAASRIEVRGNKDANRVTLDPTPPTIRIDLKQGADFLGLGDMPRMSGDRVTLGGQRGDQAAVSSTTGQSLALGERRVPGRLTLSGTTKLDAFAPTLDVLGSPAGDDALLGGCRIVVDGRAGDDTLRRVSGSGQVFACAGETPLPDEVQTSVKAVGARISGGSGDDTLLGANRSRDVLIGGRGYDVAKGASRPPFGDVCRAEKRIKCGR